MPTGTYTYDAQVRESPTISNHVLGVRSFILEINVDSRTCQITLEGPLRGVRSPSEDAEVIERIVLGLTKDTY